MSPSYPYYYRSNLKKSDQEKITFLTECLKEKEEELALLNKCLEEKENELKTYKNKNNKNNNIKRINMNENNLYDQIEKYEYEIENKNKEILLLKKRIRNLLIYLKKKDSNILILDNELRILEKENEEIKIDNNNLIKENQKLEKIKNVNNILSKGERIRETGDEKYNKYYIEQKIENENLRNRYNALFEELNDYRKKNAELTKELNNLKEDWKNMYQ